MTRTIVMLLAAGLGLAAQAQAEEEKVPVFIYATYMDCKPAGLQRADEIVKTHYAARYEKAEKDGVITGWGWLGHHTGGTMDRIVWHTASSAEAAVAAVGKISAGEDTAAVDKEFSGICDDHADYVWQSLGGGGSLTGRVHMSTYHVCDMTREDEADKLVKDVLGPIYDKYTGEGKLTGWGWSSHVIGGQYRRLGTMNANDMATLIKIRGQIIEEIGKLEGTSKFSDYCSSHTDYIWFNPLAD